MNDIDRKTWEGHKERMNESNILTGAILAGGLGLRMGQPKEGVLLPDGRPMIEHVIASLLPLCQRIVIIGTCRGFAIPSSPRFITLPDETPGMGPLHAIATILKSEIDMHGYLITACDQPFLSPDLLGRLAAGEKSTGPRIFQRTSSEMLTPLPGYYPVCWLSEINKQLLSGECSLCNAIQSHPASFIPISEKEELLLRNINTPDDLNSVFKMRLEEQL
ncbi:MAG: molybdenum cofactor guanylyltransferase [Nitrospirota bacterium]